MPQGPSAPPLRRLSCGQAGLGAGRAEGSGRCPLELGQG